MVPAGATVPVAFYDETSKPAPQQKFFDKIIEDFQKDVSAPVPGLSEQEVWQAAKDAADRRYLVLYGFERYNELSIRAAREAAKERRAYAATPAATPAGSN